MLRNQVFHTDIAPRNCRREHEGACLNLIRDNRIGGAVKPRHTDNADHIGACALDIRAHAVQKVCDVHNVRFLCRILEYGSSLRECRCHHHIDGCADRDNIEKDMLAAKSLRRNANPSVDKFHLSAECREALQMLVYGALSDITAARHRHIRPPVLAEQGADQIIRGANPLHILRFHRERRDGFAVDAHGVRVKTRHFRPDLPDCLQHHIDIPDVR